MNQTDRFIARGQCGGWQAWQLRLINVSDVLIFAAYLVIPLMLLYYIRNRARFAWRVNPVAIVAFVWFIASCGCTHLCDFAMTWWPRWDIDTYLHAVTAVASWAAIWATWNLVKHLPAETK